MKRTYTEAQYSTPEAARMIREQFLCGASDHESIEAVARYMARTLRIGPLPVCRALVVGAINSTISAA